MRDSPARLPWRAVACGLWSHAPSAGPGLEPCARAHHGEVQRRLLQVVGVVRVGAVLEQAADLPRVKRADVMGYHAQRAGDALPLGYEAGQAAHGCRVPARRRQVQRALLRVRLRLCRARREGVSSGGMAWRVLGRGSSPVCRASSGMGRTLPLTLTLTLTLILILALTLTSPSPSPYP